MTNTPITAATVLASLSARIENVDDGVVGTALGAIAKYDGKTISKRIATAVGKALPEFRVFYKVCKYSKQATVEFWGKDIDYRQSIAIVIGRAGEELNFEAVNSKELNPRIAYARKSDDRRRADMADVDFCLDTAHKLERVRWLKAELAAAEKELDDALSMHPDDYALKALTEVPK